MKKRFLLWCGLPVFLICAQPAKAHGGENVASAADLRRAVAGVNSPALAEAKGEFLAQYFDLAPNQQKIFRSEAFGGVTVARELRAIYGEAWRSLPAAARERYEVLRGGAAQDLLEKAKKENYDFRQRDELWAKFPFTQAGREARLISAAIYLERGEHAAANEQFHQLLDMTAADDTLLSARTLFRAALARARSSETDSVEGLIAKAEKKLGPAGTLQIGKEHFTPAQLRAEMKRPVEPPTQGVREVKEAVLRDLIAAAEHPNLERRRPAEAALQNLEPLDLSLDSSGRVRDALHQRWKRSRSAKPICVPFPGVLLTYEFTKLKDGTVLASLGTPVRNLRVQRRKAICNRWLNQPASRPLANRYGPSGIHKGIF